jgi:hypothetical protein
MTKRRFLAAGRAVPPFVAAVFFACGCGGRTVQKPPAALARSKAEAPLPEWARKNPSPQFLRAARVLKPLPKEFWAQPGNSLEEHAFGDRMVGTYPAAWEFFGTLTTQQVQRFLSSHEKKILIPVKSLTSVQRGALDNWFEDWRKEWSGFFRSDDQRGPILADRRVALYRLGAKEDLSNVDAGFDVADHLVRIASRIRQPDGTVKFLFGASIATL